MFSCIEITMLACDKQVAWKMVMFWNQNGLLLLAGPWPTNTQSFHHFMQVGGPQLLVSWSNWGGMYSTSALFIYFLIRLVGNSYIYIHIVLPIAVKNVSIHLVKSQLLNKERKQTLLGSKGNLIFQRLSPNILLPPMPKAVQILGSKGLKHFTLVELPHCQSYKICKFQGLAV